jgi:hypothetical protein
MDEKLILREAVKTAWSVYLATHGNVDVTDQRLCSLERHLSQRLLSGETEVDELNAPGLRTSTDYRKRMSKPVFLGVCARVHCPLLNRSYFERFSRVPRNLGQNPRFDLG